MLSFKSLCVRMLLGFLMAIGAGAALAGPIYHVSINTAALSGSGYLGLSFSALAGATPATATISRFTGDFGTDVYVQGIAGGDISTSVTFGNGETFNELLQAVHFGGLFTFDIAFATEQLGTIGTNFGVALINAALNDYVAGTSGDFLVIALMPGAADRVSITAEFANVSQVPEPGSAALFGAGFLVLLLVWANRPPSARRGS
jgi:hypothetical protein